MANTAFPSDLVQAQRDWNRTYAQLAEGAPDGTTLRRRLLRLSVRLLWHPFWETERGRSPAARAELRRHAREQAHAWEEAQERAQAREQARDEAQARDRDVPVRDSFRDREMPARDTRRVRDALR